MIRFDKLKIVADSCSISCINDEKFIKQVLKGNVVSWKYTVKMPYLLCLIVVPEHRELSIEFTGKILGDGYIHLINQENIRECLEKINHLGICTLDVDRILNESKVVKCDVTVDVDCGDLKRVVSYIEQHIANYKKWKVLHKSNGLVLMNSAGTPRYKKRLTIYDKEHEMNLAANADFLNGLSDRNGMLNYFKGKIRFELNIWTEAQIRSLLQIEKNTLNEVLGAVAHPLRVVLSEVLTSDCDDKLYKQDYTSYLHFLLLRECDFNLDKVEVKIRSLTGKNTSIKRRMRPYRVLLSSLQESEGQPSLQWQGLLEKL